MKTIKWWIVAFVLAVLCSLEFAEAEIYPVQGTPSKEFPGLSEQDVAYAKAAMTHKFREPKQVPFGRTKTLRMMPTPALRDFLDETNVDGFRGRDVILTYTDKNGVTVKEPYRTVFPRFVRDFRATFITGTEFAEDPNAGIEDIPTYGLALEHWWMSFEVLMKAQREYSECVAAINENYRLLGLPELHSPESPLRQIMLTIKEYWVPSFPIEWNSATVPPNKEVVLTHFIAGIASANQAVFHVGLCEITLGQARFAVKAEYGR